MMDSVDIESTDLEEDKNNDAIAIFDKNSGHLQCFNPEQNTWTQMQKLNNDMMKKQFSAVTVDDSVYVLMEDKKVFRLDKYSNKDAKWEKMADMLENHGSCPPAVVLESSIYVIGGHIGHETAFFEKYNSVLNVWTKLADKPRLSKSSELNVFQGQIYCFGGTTAGQYSDLVDQFDLETEVWATVGHMTKVKGYLSAVTFDGEIYVMGGCDRSTDFNNTENYVPRRNRWYALKPMLTGRSWFRTFAMHDDIYAVGGYYSSPDSMEKYNIAKNEWKMVEIPKDKKLEIIDSVKIKLKS